MRRLLTQLSLGLMVAGVCACSRFASPRAAEDLSLLRFDVVPVPPVTRAVRVERARPTGLRFTVMPEHARVYVDGRALGLARQLGTLLAVPPGVHQVSIQLEGHATWRAEVMVGDRPEPIQVTLTAVP